MIDPICSEAAGFEQKAAHVTAVCPLPSLHPPGPYLGPHVGLVATIQKSQEAAQEHPMNVPMSLATSLGHSGLVTPQPQKGIPQPQSLIPGASLCISFPRSNVRPLPEAHKHRRTLNSALTHRELSQDFRCLISGLKESPAGWVTPQRVSCTPQGSSFPPVPTQAYLVWFFTFPNDPAEGQGL